ncbi:carbon starvation CstA family protein [Desulfosporosinus metallidurans]|uniref:Carbon starvation protein A n=1 Tax=Desulfosporosinus metallidurans TaxID=1888891 RepID=A0A1Q8QWB6_9FIRM|nr:carbon starvation protein A [Desulfosporosinus metallidurans]OLN31647.1 Carbon starvation protein A [Desulfosporosinus metallidurans]
MNALTLVIISACVLILSYRIYGAFLTTKVLMVDESRVTPAHRLNDGQNFVPTNKWVVFGHHFAAIAGAGPLVGPVLAAQFGFLPGTVWILIGAVMAGAVHDLVILFASVRYDGRSLSEIAKEELGSVSGLATAISILFILVLAMAGLAVVVVGAVKNNPWGAFTISMTIPIALLVGLYMYKLRPGKVGEASFIGFALVIIAVALGPTVQNSGLAQYFNWSEKALWIILPSYGLVAAILPVWLLLAPRDYISTYLKIGTIAALALGIFWVHPVLQMPAISTFGHAGSGPVVPGPIWPFVSITIACGALSGFHALISSGTTPKMISSERDLRLVGFGGMLMEGFVAMMALIAATVLAPGDYFAINLAPKTFASLHLATVELQRLSSLVGMDLAGRTGGAVTLAVGMAHIFSKVLGEHLMKYWYQFAIMFEALFILTTIDAGTRVGRYILQDFLGRYVYKPFKNTNWWPGVIITSITISFAWGYMLYGGNVASIWPIFGVSNQLLGVIALAIGTTVILRNSTKMIYAWTTLVPLFYMVVTVFDAGVWSVRWNYLPKNDYLKVSMIIIMLALVVIILTDSVVKWNQIITARKAGKSMATVSRRLTAK